ASLHPRRPHRGRRHRLFRSRAPRGPAGGRAGRPAPRLERGAARGGPAGVGLAALPPLCAAGRAAPDGDRHRRSGRRGVDGGHRPRFRAGDPHRPILVPPLARADRGPDPRGAAGALLRRDAGRRGPPSVVAGRRRRPAARPRGPLRRGGADAAPAAQGAARERHPQPGEAPM
ncbi:MAG: hypothetical protein AVDCRST_MAG08-2092, partial [uncultured Acetobacteraceae bacterium]